MPTAPIVINGVATTETLPNYAGELFTSDPQRTPFLSMIGGLTGGRITNSVEFNVGQLYNLEEASQPNISERASLTAPEPTHTGTEQFSNVVQIHHKSIKMSYLRQSDRGTLQGLNLAGQTANPVDQYSQQLAWRLTEIARDVEYSFIRGIHNKSTTDIDANRTRGMLELAKTASHIDAAGALLNKALLKELAREMAENGAYLGNMVLFAPAFQRQLLTDIYELTTGYNTPAARTIGGMSVNTIITDFFDMGIVWNPYMPDDTILIADVSMCAPVFLPVPGKGVLFDEPLDIKGAASESQVYGQIGLDHGMNFMHGCITGLDAGTPTAPPEE